VPRAYNKPEFGPCAPVAAALLTDWGLGLQKTNLYNYCNTGTYGSGQLRIKGWVDPGVGEPALMRKRFPFLGPFLASRARDDHGIPIAVQLHVIGNLYRELGGLVPDGGQELRLGHHRSIVVGEHKIAVQ
jgi:hypothetical protein